jgi:hypothetical protein
MSEENTPDSTATAQIQIADIVMACNIIDLATQRGAFKAAEAGQVGTCFEKLVAFVKANTPEEEEAKPEEAKASKEK